MARSQLSKLIADINKVKQRDPANVKVTTCLGFHSALNLKRWRMEVLTLIPAGQGLWKADHAGVKSRLPDLYGVSVYAKLPLQEGKKNTKYWYDYAIANVANGKPVMLGEVGWPSAGKPDNGAAVTSVENEKIYTTDIVNAVKDGQFGPTFLFEA